MVTLARFAAFALLFASACAAPVSSEEEGELSSSQDALGAGPATVLESTTGAETRIRAAGLSLWVDTVAQPRREGNELWVTMRLRVSRSLESVLSFVPDDGFGNARLVSPRVVEIDLRGGHEINSILSGLPLFVSMRTTSGPVRNYEARLDLAPRFARFSGSNGVSIDRDIQPILVRSPGDNLRYRGKVTASGASSMSVFTDDDSDPEVAKTGSGAWRFDWTYGNLELAADIPTDPVYFIARAAGSDRAKEAGIDFAVSRVGLTKESAYDVWPSPTCKPAVRACIQSKPASAVDLGDCGTYRQVNACL